MLRGLDCWAVNFVDLTTRLTSLVCEFEPQKPGFHLLVRPCFLPTIHNSHTSKKMTKSTLINQSNPKTNVNVCTMYFCLYVFAVIHLYKCLCVTTYIIYVLSEPLWPIIYYVLIMCILIVYPKMVYFVNVCFQYLDESLVVIILFVFVIPQWCQAYPWDINISRRRV